MRIYDSISPENYNSHVFWKMWCRTMCSWQ